MKLTSWSSSSLKCIVAPIGISEQGTPLLRFRKTCLSGGCWDHYIASVSGIWISSGFPSSITCPSVKSSLSCLFRMRSAPRDSTPFLYSISRSVRHSLSTILCYWFISLFTVLALSISLRRCASSSVSPPSLWYHFREVFLASICSFYSSDKWLSLITWNEASTITWRIPRIKDSKRGFESLLRRLFILSSYSYDVSAI